jgi:prepilin-type N-terminal cleavage/methylation domain-containing protein
MRARKSSGFTLIELLVVIVIISTLIGLMIPAVLYSREYARRNTCTNNQHEIAVALQQYETATGQWPGWINSVGDRPGLSWAAVLLPYMGHNDAWAALRVLGGVQLNPPSELNIPRRIPQLVCPDTSPTQDFALTYVVNVGHYSAGDNFTVSSEQPQYGLFFNHDRDAAYGRYQEAVTRSEAIADGAANTLAFSENVLGSQWYALGTAAGLAVRRWNAGGGNLERRPWAVDSTILWRAPDPAVPCQYINTRLDDRTTFPWSDAPNAGTEDSTNVGQFRQYCRPSSYHPGGVVATYCDGHQAFVADTIDHSVYLESLIPDDAQAITDGVWSTTW